MTCIVCNKNLSNRQIKGFDPHFSTHCCGSWVCPRCWEMLFEINTSFKATNVQLYEKVGDDFKLTDKTFYEKIESVSRENIECPGCSNKLLTDVSAEAWGFDDNVNPWDFLTSCQ